MGVKCGWWGDGFAEIVLELTDASIALRSLDGKDEGCGGKGRCEGDGGEFCGLGVQSCGCSCSRDTVEEGRYGRHGLLMSGDKYANIKVAV